MFTRYCTSPPVICVPVSSYSNVAERDVGDDEFAPDNLFGGYRREFLDVENDAAPLSSPLTRTPVHKSAGSNSAMQEAGAAGYGQSQSPVRGTEECSVQKSKKFRAIFHLQYE